MPYVLRSIAVLLLVWGGVPQPARAQPIGKHAFEVERGGEGVASIVAGCGRCDWGIAGREAVVLKLSIDGRYSQHLPLARGESPVEYRVLLGRLPPGAHTLVFERDAALSARDAGPVRIDAVRVDVHGPESPEYAWLSRAPFLHARPETLERFSDIPLMMYAEAAAQGGGFDYTVIFSHEDGGTPTDRLMATWGRATDIEFVYGFRPAADGQPAREEYQGHDHAILPYRGAHSGTHPVLWVSTINNMFSDSGTPAAPRLAPAPHLVTLAAVSREAVMDANPWLYAISAAELHRENRIDRHAAPGSGRIPDPRTFAVIEACGEVQDATLAFDLAVGAGDSAWTWHATDRGEPQFRIARSGCFRGAVPLPADTPPTTIRSLRARVYTRPAGPQEASRPDGTGRVRLHRVNAVLMLDARHQPRPTGLRWTGTIEIRAESPPVPIDVSR